MLYFESYSRHTSVSLQNVPYSGVQNFNMGHKDDDDDNMAVGQCSPILHNVYANLHSACENFGYLRIGAIISTIFLVIVL